MAVSIGVQNIHRVRQRVVRWISHDTAYAHRSASGIEKMNSKVIEFPQKGKRGKDSIERDMDFEAGVTFQIFLDKEDYVGLVQYCKERALKNPDDPYAQYYLGHAYVLNSQYQKAIEFMQLHHKKYPRNWDYHFVILEALFALGKTEDDFD